MVEGVEDGESGVEGGGWRGVGVWHTGSRLLEMLTGREEELDWALSLGGGGSERVRG